MTDQHETTPVRLTIEVDKRIALLVTAIHEYDGMRTISSCEDAKGNGIAEVIVQWVTQEAIEHLSDALVDWNDRVDIGFHAHLDDFQITTHWARLRVETVAADRLAERLRIHLAEEAREVGEEALRLARAVPPIINLQPPLDDLKTSE